MKIVTQVKLMPEAGQAAALSSTLRTVNEAANRVSEIAFAHGMPREYELRKHTYAHLKEQGLGAQAAQHVIKKVRDAYTTLKANIRAGNLGEEGSKRRLKARARKEARHAANQNHIISKTIVTEAERTGRGLALEELQGIRDRVRLRKPPRVAVHSWAFAQLADFLVYKAKRAGVPLVFVDPAYTSQMCAECRHIDKRNHLDQGLFMCRGCGVVAHADRNASHNIATRGESVWNAGRESRVPATP